MEPAVDKRISALAVAIQMGATVYDLEEAELCYAPQFGSAKDAVNFAGMVAADVLDDDMPLAHWDHAKSAFLLDVRQPMELVVERVPGAVNIPLPQLRARLDELPRDREILIICRSGGRAYFATRILLQHGFRARTLSGRNVGASRASGCRGIRCGYYQERQGRPKGRTRRPPTARNQDPRRMKRIRKAGAARSQWFDERVMNRNAAQRRLR